MRSQSTNRKNLVEVSQPSLRMRARRGWAAIAKFYTSKMHRIRQKMYLQIIVTGTFATSEELRPTVSRALSVDYASSTLHARSSYLAVVHGISVQFCYFCQEAEELCSFNYLLLLLQSLYFDLSSERQTSLRATDNNCIRRRAHAGV